MKNDRRGGGVVGCRGGGGRVCMCSVRKWGGGKIENRRKGQWQWGLW